MSKTKPICLTLLVNLRGSENRKIPKGIHLIIGGVFKNPGRTVAIISIYCQEILELARSVLEEAGTRMFAHLNYNVCTLNCTTGVIYSIDLQSCGFKRMIPRLLTIT